MTATTPVDNNANSADQANNTADKGQKGKVVKSKTATKPEDGIVENDDDTTAEFFKKTKVEDDDMLVDDQAEKEKMGDKAKRVFHNYNVVWGAIGVLVLAVIGSYLFTNDVKNDGAKDVASLRTDITDVTKSVAGLTKAMTVQQANVDKLLDVGKKQGDEIVALTDRVGEHDVQIAGVKKDTSEQGAALALIEEKSADQADKIAQLGKSVRVLTGANKGMVAMLGEHGVKITKIQNDMSGLSTAMVSIDRRVQTTTVVLAPTATPTAAPARTASVYYCAGSKDPATKCIGGGLYPTQQEAEAKACDDPKGSGWIAACYSNFVCGSWVSVESKCPSR